MDDKVPSPLGVGDTAPLKAYVHAPDPPMEDKPVGSTSKSEPEHKDPRSSNSTSEEKYKMDHAPDEDYQHSSSTSESEDDLVEGEVTYTDGCPDTVPSSFREKLNFVMAEHKELQRKNMAESVEMVEKLRVMIDEFEGVQKRHVIENSDYCNELAAIAAKCIRRLQLMGAKVAREEERIKDMEEVPREEVLRWLESISEICNRPA